MVNEDTSAATAASTDAAHVLFIEDDDSDALLVEELLYDAGATFVIQRVRSLTQAKSLVKGMACVLLDLGLPDSQGLDGLKQLVQIEPHAAVVVLTGNVSEHPEEEAIQAGADDTWSRAKYLGRCCTGSSVAP